MLSAVCFNLDKSKIFSSGNGLKSRTVKSNACQYSSVGRTCERNVSGHCRLWFRIPGWPTKITISLSDKMLKRGPM